MKKLLIALLLFNTAAAQPNFAIGYNNHGPEVSAGYTYGKVSGSVQQTLSISSDLFPHLSIAKISYAVGNIFNVSPVIGIAYHAYAHIPSSEYHAPGTAYINEYDKLQARGLYLLYGAEIRYKFCYAAYSYTGKFSLISVGMKFYLNGKM